jgi:hypothetical protein
VAAVEDSDETGSGKRRGPMLSETHSETSAMTTSKARGPVNLNLVVLRVIFSDANFNAKHDLTPSKYLAPPGNACMLRKLRRAARTGLRRQT